MEKRAVWKNAPLLFLHGCIKEGLAGIIITRGDEMYSYVKEKKLTKRKLLLSLGTLLIVSAACISYSYTQQRDKKQERAVFKEESVPVLALPDTTQKGVKPFSVDAQVVLDFFDGKDSKVDSITEFEGVYRANQGMDYALNNEVFEVQAIFAGVVSDVREDELFGKTVEIKSDALTITYQSLADVAVKKGDEVSQKAMLAKAGGNIYNKELGNHVHIVVEKNDQIIDPELVYGKTLEELK